MYKNIPILLIALTSISCTDNSKEGVQSPAPSKAEDTTKSQINVSPIQTSETQVNGHDSNRAKALLYRWWSAFEAPDRSASAAWLDGLFTPRIDFKLESVELDSAKAIQDAFQYLPPDKGRAHQLESVSVKALDENTLKLEAEFLYQINEADGSVTSGRSGYVHDIARMENGSLAFKKMRALVSERINTPLLDNSFIANRARGTVHQYLGITDRLGSDYTALKNILSEDAEIHGMFDPAIETHNSRKDGVLRGWQEISDWLATRENSLAEVRHDIMSLNVAKINNNMIETDVKVSVRAQPKTGNLIAVTLPIKITLTDTGETFMRISKIER